MFGLGFFEILIILLVVIVFVNPKDLPKLFRRIGWLYQQLRTLKESSFQYLRSIEREIEEGGNSQGSDRDPGINPEPDDKEELPHEGKNRK